MTTTPPAKAKMDMRRKIYTDLKTELLAEHHVLGHPKSDMCFALAWDYGHDKGVTEVKHFFRDLVQLIK